MVHGDYVLVFPSTAWDAALDHFGDASHNGNGDALAPVCSEGGLFASCASGGSNCFVNKF